VRWAEGLPAEVVVHGHAERIVDVKTWADLTLSGVVLRLPASAKPDENGVIAVPIGEGTLRVSIGPAGDPFSDAYRDGLAETCGCRVVDRTTAFVDGRAGSRYLVAVADPDRALLGEVWAVPFAGGTLLATYLAPGTLEATPDPRDVLAEGYAALALARWASK
jgi:hypothetical protein